MFKIREDYKIPYVHVEAKYSNNKLTKILNMYKNYMRDCIVEKKDIIAFKDWYLKKIKDPDFNKLKIVLEYINGRK